MFALTCKAIFSIPLTAWSHSMVPAFRFGEWLAAAALMPAWGHHMSCSSLSIWSCGASWTFTKQWLRLAVSMPVLCIFSKSSVDCCHAYATAYHDAACTLVTYVTCRRTSKTDFYDRWHVWIDRQQQWQNSPHVGLFWCIHRPDETKRLCGRPQWYKYQIAQAPRKKLA